MEHVEAILYHKIQESDFTNMYGIKKPTGGGGQTYIQAAGYTREELDRMFKDAGASADSPEFWDKEHLHPRKKYVIDAYTVGSSAHAVLELAPRTGRKDYRICRQNPRYRHPAWQEANGFPSPRRAPDGFFVFERNYPGIIDSLYIMIIKTMDGHSAKYYASFVNADALPPAWPHGTGLENIFAKGKKQGILFFDEEYLRFANDREVPFQTGSAADDVLENVALPDDLCELADDPVEYAGRDVPLHIDSSHIEAIKVEPPVFRRKRAAAAARSIAKDTDYERRQKNLKRIGDAGEALALAIERTRLASEGRDDLAAKVEHVAKTVGDGLGYDIKSFENVNGTYEDKYIEVKATTGGKSKPFDISANEVEVSEEKGQRYCIYRFYGIADRAAQVKYYEVRGPIKEHFSLEPTSYKAYFKA